MQLLDEGISQYDGPIIREQIHIVDNSKLRYRKKFSIIHQLQEILNPPYMARRFRAEVGKLPSTPRYRRPFYSSTYLTFQGANLGILIYRSEQVVWYLHGQKHYGRVKGKPLSADIYRFRPRLYLDSKEFVEGRLVATQYHPAPESIYIKETFAGRTTAPTIFHPPRSRFEFTGDDGCEPFPLPSPP